MQKETKKVISAKRVQRFETLFSCPICESSMIVESYDSLVCSNHHRFDFAKQGYLNLLTRHVTTKYTKTLFESRQKLMSEAGFFKPVTNKIIAILNQFFTEVKEPILMLDSGCGEGSHLDYMSQMVTFNAQGVGIDISKEAITTAAKYYPNQIWTVADLARMPFRNSQFDVILNILSPSNYSEFDRLLNPGGLVVKVIPRAGYLKELRHYFYNDSTKRYYRNDNTVDRFSQQYQIDRRVVISETLNLSLEAMEWLIEMTPLTWHTSEIDRLAFLNKNDTEVTLDVEILIGRKTI